MRQKSVEPLPVGVRFRLDVREVERVRAGTEDLSDLRRDERLKVIRERLL